MSASQSHNERNSIKPKRRNSKRCFSVAGNSSGSEKRKYDVLDFEEEVLPKNVSLGFFSYSVIEYTTMPMKCYNCRRFGHTAKACKGRRRCAQCGEDHEYE